LDVFAEAKIHAHSYVLERMKIGSVEYRLGKILEHDWRAEAAELLQARKAGLESGNVSASGAFFFSQRAYCIVAAVRTVILEHHLQRIAE
jgi:hypothetical protein